MKTCIWIKEPTPPERPDVYCGKPVKYTMEPDGGEPGAPRKRKYQPFCDAHQKLADEMND